MVVEVEEMAKSRWDTETNPVTWVRHWVATVIEANGFRFTTTIHGRTVTDAEAAYKAEHPTVKNVYAVLEARS